MPQPPICDVLLVTVTNVETEAVLAVADGGEPPYFGNQFTSTKLGCPGNTRVFHLQTEMAGDAAPQLHQAIAAHQPESVIFVGIAYGMDRDKYPVGTVLVSEQIKDLNHRRQGTDHKGQPTLDYRGPQIPASKRLLDRFKYAQRHWSDSPLCFGLVLSGQELLDNRASRDKLRQKYPEALGGEMEGAVLFDIEKEWILVKSVCDWADGRKNKNKC